MLVLRSVATPSPQRCAPGAGAGVPSSWARRRHIEKTATACRLRLSRPRSWSRRDRAGKARCLVAGPVARRRDPSGLVRLWVFDPKGGMEFGDRAPMFARFVCEDFEAMAEHAGRGRRSARERPPAARLTRQHTPTVADPLYVIVIDELAALTAYLTDRQLKTASRRRCG